MRRLIKFLIFFAAIAAGVNAYLESQRECTCDADCWCKQPGLKHFRWIFPVGHRDRGSLEA